MFLAETESVFNLIVQNVWEIIVMTSLLALQSIVSWMRSRNTHKKIENISKEQKEIKYEVSANGGDTSLKDVLTKVSEKVDKMDEKIESIFASKRASVELALDQSPVAQCLLNEKGEVDYANDAATEFFGMNKAHFQKRKWIAIIVKQQDKVEAISRLEFMLVNKNLFELGVVTQNFKTKRQFPVNITIEQKTDAKDMFMWYLMKIKEVHINH